VSHCSTLLILSLFFPLSPTFSPLSDHKMARTKKIARKGTGGKAPRKQLAKKVVSKAELASRQAMDPNSNEEEEEAGSGEEDQEEEEEEEGPAQKKQKVETAATEEDQLESAEEGIVAKEDEIVDEPMKPEGIDSSGAKVDDSKPQDDVAQPEVEGQTLEEVEKKSVESKDDQVVAESKE